KRSVEPPVGVPPAASRMKNGTWTTCEFRTGAASELPSRASVAERRSFDISGRVAPARRALGWSGVPLAQPARMSADVTRTTVAGRILELSWRSDRYRWLSTPPPPVGDPLEGLATGNTNGPIVAAGPFRV